ncbi:hypothetical protein IDM40_13250 [Nocardiopsis sp. HNM0947]|uniref:Uncharacterized protein n=1 Tax=Nocardiopsis coralli TaxID=2772213 RepID=A0ABR9P742_9ACTN|nr:hypothetical protein [Nocardiopsis coralli]MBE2999667.1 hypothetical protein [Nocardiopsis coralli]
MINYVLEPTQEGQLRRRVLFWLPAPLPVLGLVALLVGGALSASGWTILLAASVGVGTLLLAVIVQPTPLPEGLTPQVSARRSLHRFRQFTGLRIALALVPVAIGAAASLIGGGMYPLFAALALAWPQILMAMPTFFTITRARRAMEAWGTTAYLWHALSRPSKVTWPLVTSGRRIWRQWREDRAKARAVSRREAELRRSEQAERDQARDPEVVLPHPDQVTTARIPSLSAGQDGDEASEQQEQGETAGDGEGAGVGGDEIEPTAKMPALDEDTPAAGNPAATTGTGSERTSGTVLERGGALSQRVRRTRRGAQSTRRPHSHKP